jgi:predicted DCC family thiol-disulfide oxidoreductase YuxK
MRSTAETGTFPVVVLFDADCGICSQTARLLRTLDTAERLRLLPLESAASTLPDAPPLADLRRQLHARSPDGEWSSGGDAVRRIAAAVPVLRPLSILGSLPVARGILDVTYDLVAANRHRLSRLLRTPVCRVEPAPVTRPRT